ncbi:MAG: mandelate racemase/muconate lactonizing enzyme family protein [SAR324 cluster bacterium]|nr:mandelate racemase/muconate lactonizing enzyme family protein [SAR324 cluster bacterium]
MIIEAVDLFYLSMPEITNEVDGSQDALLVRVSGSGLTGWGECEASPLTSIANFICPKSHGAAHPVSYSVLGQELNSPQDIVRISNEVREKSLTILQTPHTFSGIEIALWDLLGKYLEEPVYKMLGFDKTFSKTPYASQLFGTTPDETYEKAKSSLKTGYRAVKFGWGKFGIDLTEDQKHIEAAREGLGTDCKLMVDVGSVWKDDLNEASSRLDMLEKAGVQWLEEPFYTDSFSAYKGLSQSTKVPLAGGEGCHNPLMAKNMIDFCGLGFIQIDSGIIGGIGSAKEVADYAVSRDVQFVNHTFTSHLAFVSSILPYCGYEDFIFCEYPVQLKPLAWDITIEHIQLNDEGKIDIPEKTGLGIEVDVEGIKPYLSMVKIELDGKDFYQTPSL